VLSFRPLAASQINDPLRAKKQRSRSLFREPASFSESPDATAKKGCGGANAPRETAHFFLAVVFLAGAFLADFFAVVFFVAIGATFLRLLPVLEPTPI
jgi:hypothetical protein